ncbi:MAG: 4Fe-4S dicluster domain-containing protein [Promethearchaeota archaeon]
MTKKNTIVIEINEEKCTGCIICRLWCSYTHFKIFNPSKANILIEDQYGQTPMIYFGNECTNCGECARHCLYGALRIKGGDS